MAEDHMTFVVQLKREGDGKLTVSFPASRDSRQSVSLGTTAEGLLSAVETDYTEYYCAFQDLEKHPLFEPKIDIPVGEYVDFMQEAMRVPDLLKDRDPISFETLRADLEKILRHPDDGSASWLLLQGGLSCMRCQRLICCSCSSAISLKWCLMIPSGFLSRTGLTGCVRSIRRRRK